MSGWHMSPKNRSFTKDTTAVDNEGFRRVHRLTPLLRFWSLILALVTIFVLNFGLDFLFKSVNYIRSGHWSQVGYGSLIVVGVFAGLCVGMWFLSDIWWRRSGFMLGSEEISIRHGVVFTVFHSARYDRIQAVDVVEKAIARIFGLAAVRVETAGSGSASIEIRYLPKPEAEAVRREVLSHVHGVSRPKPGEERELLAPFIEEVPVCRTLLAEALRLPAITVAVFIAVLWFSPVDHASVIPLVVGFVPNVWRLVDTSWRFSARHDRDRGVLDLSYGLANRRRQAIRLNSVHGVKVTQPFLWRLFGWYEVQVSVAGYGTKSGDKQSGSTRILPVGTRQQAVALFALVSPLSREQIEHYARPEGHTNPTFTSPSRVRLASPVDFRRQSVTLLGDVAITHSGRIARRVCAIDLPHIQELTYKKGPLSQLLNLANVRFDLVRGPVRMGGFDLDPTDAAELLSRLRSRQLPADLQRGGGNES